jgi:uncharacterized protein YcbK (DUF882 family)
VRAALLTIAVLLFSRDAPAHGVARARTVGEDVPLGAAPRATRTASWAEALPPVDIRSMHDAASCTIRLYTPDGEIDETARMQLEHVATTDGRQHALDARLAQLVVKAAYHFHDAHVVVVSGWREHAGRHSTGEALDFKLDGVRAATLAAYLRGLPRVGVGIYTHPRTQYVHLDVREPSYHWIDASPPGVTWRERRLGDPGQTKRDASWTPEGDLPL